MNRKSGSADGFDGTEANPTETFTSSHAAIAAAGQRGPVVCCTSNSIAASFVLFVRFVVHGCYASSRLTPPVGATEVPIFRSLPDRRTAAACRLVAGLHTPTPALPRKRGRVRTQPAPCLRGKCGARLPLPRRRRACGDPSGPPPLAGEGSGGGDFRPWPRPGTPVFKGAGSRHG